MKVLTKYLIREILKYLLICEYIFYLIYLSFDFLGKIDNFIEAGVNPVKVFYYFLYKSPLILAQMMPPAMLVSVVLVFSLVKKRNELTAIKAQGIDILWCFVPVFGFSLLISILLFLSSELIIPFTSSAYNRIWILDVERRDPSYLLGLEKIWYKGDNLIYQMESFDPKSMIMDRPTIYFFDHSFQLSSRIDAQKAQWTQNGWILYGGIIQRRDKLGGFIPIKFDTYLLNVKETPECFLRKPKEPEEISYWELKKFSERLAQEGYDNIRYQVDLNLKLAFPFIVLVMTIIGIPVAILIEKGGIPFAVMVGILVCFLYTISLLYSRNLGISGALTPVISVWLPNVVFCGSGFYLLKRMER